MFFKNTGIFLLFLKIKELNPLLPRFSNTEKNQRKKRALPALHKKRRFSYKYRFFRNQSACGGR
jgi:hypothetical protein